MSRVYYPGLSSHGTHAVAKRILDHGFGAMVSFEVVGGLNAANALVNHCRHIAFAPSLGGVLTTLSHPGLTSHRAYSATDKEELGITEGLLRLSVGAEPLPVILDDLVQALDATTKG